MLGFSIYMDLSVPQYFNGYVITIVCKDAAIASKVECQLKLVIRLMYSNPSIHGEFINATFLKGESESEHQGNNIRDIQKAGKLESCFSRPRIEKCSF
ncbi:hypothetical protein KY290_006959 [Solanum tuberosum]|uniref:Uncharacterized protein n=1 Tax=Solanum tuberosum TaxID=4113 RepID=A0ABQ7W4A1_SOLTU|nr:hypothetical protein KY290_006959 [Solanum tuberosum]